MMKNSCQIAYAKNYLAMIRGCMRYTVAKPDEYAETSLIMNMGHIRHIDVSDKQFFWNDSNSFIWDKKGSVANFFIGNLILFG